ncbi:MAG: hypothetical protein R6W89_12375, partial [Candidatus Hydrogenedentota bacterium]
RKRRLIPERPWVAASSNKRLLARSYSRARTAALDGSGHGESDRLEHRSSRRGVATIGNFNNEWDIPA